MPTIGFLHTADVHVETFERLVAELAPGWAVRHVVDESLLADARVDGVTPAIAERVRGRLAELTETDVVVCTCSTIGATAEQDNALRADRPMADAAVAMGRRIAVVATVESTLEPTMALLRESATNAGVQVTLLPSPCLSAWQHFESGDHESYHAAVADHVRTIIAGADADVVVLAQASMAPAADLLTTPTGPTALTAPAGLPGLPVLTSPRAAVSAAISKVKSVTA
ncbi:hypothetical protein FB565_004971 [Actinoplanes lutulentus]|uniref:Asp/Glu/hydantoin racemase n=1 Tax=Actinoplanes lutulentus TaxID=1287878 RepID=A0A327ZHI6_9ACTN|nr:hypothetical protein [Actinoplanes lutulentus]MBB2945238.1 hypothetical protein [Actinoplanes lutulentus]RAK40626.1 hypothetical protein B0I29_103666 [Actinoplanes lutulentus]